MPRLITQIVISSLLLILGAACGSDDEPDASPAATSPPAAAATDVPAAAVEGTLVEVINHDQGGSGKYAFEPNEFSFAVGETVTFRMTAETEFHTFTVDQLEIDESADAGETVTFSLTFEEAGTFDLICIPHESLGMTGTITVQ